MGPGVAYKKESSKEMCAQAKGGCSRARDILKIPVWWRRAVLPSLPGGECFLRDIVGVNTPARSGSAREKAKGMTSKDSL